MTKPIFLVLYIFLSFYSLGQEESNQKISDHVMPTVSQTLGDIEDGAKKSTDKKVVFNRQDYEAKVTEAENKIEQSLQKLEQKISESGHNSAASQQVNATLEKVGQDIAALKAILDKEFATAVKDAKDKELSKQYSDMISSRVKNLKTDLTQLKEDFGNLVIPPEEKQKLTSEVQKALDKIESKLNHGLSKMGVNTVALDASIHKAVDDIDKAVKGVKDSVKKLVSKIHL